jgi:hypothetical protein
MNFQTNQQTGAQEANFTAKLISMSEKVLTNVNQKNYKVGTIEFKDINEETQRTSCFIFEGNFKHGMVIGESYLTTATLTDQGVICRVSHLTGTPEKATANMFGFESQNIQPANLVISDNSEINEKILENKAF